MNIRDLTRYWVDWLKHVITQPREELDRWQYAVRFAYELGVHGWKALERDNAPQMAAALAFRTLFAMLPVVVVTAVLVKAVQGMDQFKRLADWIIHVIGADAVLVPVPEQVKDVEDVHQVPLGTWLSDQIDKMANVDLSAVGWVGLAVMIYSAISLMVTVENSFNAVYGAPEGRYWVRRIPMYWFVLTLGPLFIGISIVINTQFESFIQHVGTLEWLLNAAKFMYGLTAAWLVFFVVYRLVPNTRVSMKAAAAGAFVSALIWQVGKSMLGAYFGGAVSLGSIAALIGGVPVFMFFVYLMWLVVLFGLEVAATIQRVQGLHLLELQELKQKQPQTGLVDPASVVSVMEIVTDRFNGGRSATLREIADEGVLSEAMVSQMVERLVKEGFLHRVDAQDGAVTLARPPEQISAQRLIDIGYDLVDEGRAGPISSFVQRLRDAQRSLAGQITLAALIQSRQASAAADQVSRA